MTGALESHSDRSATSSCVCLPERGASTGKHSRGEADDADELCAVLPQRQEDGLVAQEPAATPSWRNSDVPIPPRRNEVRDYQVDEEAVLFDPKTRKIYLLNQTALIVYRHCDGRTTMHQVAESLSASYHTASLSALDHVDRLVGLFAASNLLEEVGGA